MQEKMTVDEYCLYLRKTLKNLHSSKGLMFNVEMELKRLIKMYSLEELKKTEKIIEMIWNERDVFAGTLVMILTIFCFSTPLSVYASETLDTDAGSQKLETIEK